MNKELKAFRNICKNLNSYEFTDEYKKNKELIETALKEKVNIENRLDEIFENHNIKSFTELNERLCDYNELKFDDDIKQKNLKALEIIKDYFIFSDDPYDKVLTPKKPMEKEKIDLLKEVLV